MKLITFWPGDETYENQAKYGSQTFAELLDLNMNGYMIEQQHHEIRVISCSDWKASSCIEGKCENIQGNS